MIRDWVSDSNVFVGFVPECLRGCLGAGCLGVCDLGALVRGLARSVKSGCLL